MNMRIEKKNTEIYFDANRDIEMCVTMNSYV